MEATPALRPRDRAGGIVATGTVLALLYFGRDVLVPVTLAAILSLLIAPLVRALRRIGFGQTLSVLTAVIALAVSCAAATGVIAMHVVRMTASVPQYEQIIRDKLATLNDLTVGRINALSGQAGQLIAVGAPTTTASSKSALRQLLANRVPSAPVPVEIREPPANALLVLQKVLGSVWIPLETAGIVLVVMIFLLLEHEAVRDRFIRIAGGTDIRATTLALNDAGERLSRFFVSQFLVNAGVACAVWIGLITVGLPHALLWGALAGVLRFVPYVGVWIAALCSTVLAAAVAPGWTLAISTLGLYIVVELVAGQLVEPQLYGHATGLSPLSVVIAAIFWSWIWGPIGLIVSTPLTLCLVVAGRHIKALSLLDVLLGDTQALTMPQRFYQRALSSDSQEIIVGARVFLKRNSFAAYCDLVLMPALALARLDVMTGAISPKQQTGVRDVMVAVVAAIAGDGRGTIRRRARSSVLDQSTAGMVLRKQREQVFGPFQGPLDVAPNSVMLGVGLGTTADDLATELLVRILRDQKLDARHVSLNELNGPRPPESRPESVAAVYLVSAFPNDERKAAEAVLERLREQFPQACLVTVFFPGMPLALGNSVEPASRNADKAATSFGHAVQIALDMQLTPTATV